MRVLLACVRAWARHTQVLQFVQENVSKMRGACADVKMYQNQQIPLPYVHLLELLVTVYLTLAPAALVSQLLWVAPFVSSFVTLFFYGFFVLGTKILLDPFSTTVSVSSSARNTQKLYKNKGTHMCAAGVRNCGERLAASSAYCPRHVAHPSRRCCWRCAVSQSEEGGFDTTAFFEDTVEILEDLNARIPIHSPQICGRMVRSASVPPIFANPAAGLEQAVVEQQQDNEQQGSPTSPVSVRRRRNTTTG